MTLQTNIKSQAQNALHSCLAPLITFNLALAVATPAAKAEVFEYNSKGQFISVSPINNAAVPTKAVRAVPLKRPEKTTKTLNIPKLNDSQTRMLNLASAVAWMRAGDDSIKDANLSREQFVSIFTALIYQESRFNPKAVSPKGAKGLGQLMPETARELGVSDPFSATQNLKGSVTYLIRMLQQFGTMKLALAAYNAGPGNVRKFGGVPPFDETRKYIANILNVTERSTKLTGVKLYGLKATPENKKNSRTQYERASAFLAKLKSVFTTRQQNNVANLTKRLEH